MSQKTAFCYKNIIRNAKLRKLNSKKNKKKLIFSPVSHTHTHTQHNNKNKNKNKNNNNNSNNNNNNNNNNVFLTLEFFLIFF